MRNFLLVLGIALFCNSLIAQTIWIVNSTDDADDGVCNAAHCSFREALSLANNNVGPDSIIFDIPGAAPHLIQPLTNPLPPILDQFTVINGTSQIGNFPMAGRIIIDGSNLSNTTDHGLVIYRSHTKIYGLQVQNFPADGIQIFGGFGAPPQLLDIHIGHTDMGNIIINNGNYGIEGDIDRDASFVGNYIGTDLSYSSGLGNGWDGLFLDIRSGDNVVIGGSSIEERNYLCSNGFSGLKVNIILNQPDWTGNLSVIGNRIGTDATGTIDLGNAGGVFGGGFGGGGIVIGGDGPMVIGGPGNDKNIIAFNYDGIYHDSFDQKKFNENQWYCNTNAGITLINGANNSIATPNSICVTDGLVNGLADPNMLIEIYDIDTTLCPGGIPCQGNELLGTTMSDATGYWVYMDAAITTTSTVSVLAIDPMGNTSEFSLCSDYVSVEVSNTGPYCPGDSIFLFANVSGNVENATFFWFAPGDVFLSNEQNPKIGTTNGRYTLYTMFGDCDYPEPNTPIFTDVDFFPVTIEYITAFCAGDSWTVNGNTYDMDNTQGTEVLPGANQFGCDSIIEFDMEFNPSILGMMTTDRRYACVGDSVEVRIEAIPSSYGPYQVIYTDGTGIPDTLDNVFNGHTFMQEVTQDLYYSILDITSPFTICEPIIGTSDSVFLSELIISPIVTDYDGYGVSCKNAEDGAIILNVSGAIGTVTYDWNPSFLDGDVVTGLDASLYSVTITDDAACVIEFDTLLTEPEGPEPLLEIMDPSCEGAADGGIIIDTVFNVEGQLFWSIDSITFSPVTSYPVIIDTLMSGFQTLYLDDDSDCVAQLRVIIPRGNPSNVDAGSGQSIAAGDSIQLGFSTDIVNPTISWTPPEFMSCSTCPSPLTSPPITQYVSVYLENEQGCNATDSVLIQVFIPKRAYIPNVFSPNNDGINDFFVIYTNEYGVKIESMLVVNRGGVTVFADSGDGLALGDINQSWDGSFQGQLLNPGVFTYLINILYEDGQIIPFSGTITLIR